MELKEMLQFIQTAMPLLTIQQLEEKRRGWDNDVVLINNQWVFRFPKTEQVAEYVKIETHLLHDFRKQTSLNIKVPQPTLLYGSKQQLMCSCYDLPMFLLSILQESTGITGQRSPEWRLNITTVQRIEKASGSE